LTAAENAALPLELEGIRAKAARATALKALDELEDAVADLALEGAGAGIECDERRPMLS
jgi:hypothetical protein